VTVYYSGTTTVYYLSHGSVYGYMPKMWLRCRKCGEEGRRPVYYRKVAERGSKNCKWVKMDGVVYCERCQAITVYPFPHRNVQEILVVKGAHPIGVEEVD